MRKFLIVVPILLATHNALALDIERMNNDEVRLSGDIILGDYERFVDKAQGAKTVLLDSDGGYTLVALRIADFISREHMNVRVMKHCVSACASFLFVAGAKRIIDSNGIVLFHGSTNGQWNGMMEDQEKLPESVKLSPYYQAILATAAYKDKRASWDGERALLLRMGVSYKGLRNIERATGIYREFTGVGILSDQKTLAYRLEPKKAQVCQYWAPDERELHEIGIDLATPYAPPFSEMTKNINGLYVHNRWGVVYTGSAFDTVQIKAECQVDLENEK